MIDPEQARIRLSIYLEEYRMLKYEQVHRIGFRDNLVYVALGATAAVVSFWLKEDASPLALLALPVASFVLGWLYTNNDAKSCAIGRYLHYVLGTRLEQVSKYPELPGNDPCILGWESEVRAVPRRPWRKLTELASAIVTFVLPGMLALLTCWSKGGLPRAVLVPASIVEGGLLLALLFWMLKNSDVCWRAGAEGGS